MTRDIQRLCCPSVIDVDRREHHSLPRHSLPSEPAIHPSLLATIQTPRPALRLPTAHDSSVTRPTAAAAAAENMVIHWPHDESISTAPLSITARRSWRLMFPLHAPGSADWGPPNMTIQRRNKSTSIGERGAAVGRVSYTITPDRVPVAWDHEA